MLWSDGIYAYSMQLSAGVSKDVLLEAAASVKPSPFRPGAVRRSLPKLKLFAPKDGGKAGRMRPSNIRPALIFFYASTWQTAAVTTSPSPCGATEKDAQKLHMHLPLFMCAGFYAPRYFSTSPISISAPMGKTSSSRRNLGLWFSVSVFFSGFAEPI